jgi:hypothetical protein
MSIKAAEQLIDTVAEARIASQQREIFEGLETEPQNVHERAIRFYIQSNQFDKVSTRLIISLRFPG